MTPELRESEAAKVRPVPMLAQQGIIHIMPGGADLRTWNLFWFFPAFAFAGVYAYAKAVAADAEPFATIGALVLCVAAVLYWEHFRRLPLLALTLASVPIAIIAALGGTYAWFAAALLVTAAFAAAPSTARRLCVPLNRSGQPRIVIMAGSVLVVTVVGDMMVAGVIALALLASFLYLVRPQFSPPAS